MKYLGYDGEVEIFLWVRKATYPKFHQIQCWFLV